MLIRQIVASAFIALTLGFIVAHAPVIFTIGMVLWIALSVACAPLFGRWIAGHSADLDQGGIFFISGTPNAAAQNWRAGSAHFFRFIRFG